MISLITSLYKTNEYIEKYSKAICDYSLKMSEADIKFEIVAIANEPDEEELKILNRLSKDNSWFRYISVPRESIYASWNRGCDIAHGDYIGFWNVDDFRNVEAIIDAKKLFDQDFDLVYFPFLYKRYIQFYKWPILVKRVIVKPPTFSKEEFTRAMHCGPFFLFKKEFYNKVGPFDEQFKIAGDFDWCVRAAKIGNFVKSDKIAGIFINKGTSLSGSKDKNHSRENNIICERHSIINIKK